MEENERKTAGVSEKTKLHTSLTWILGVFFALCAVVFLFKGNYSCSAERLPAQVSAEKPQAAGTPFSFPERLRIATYNLHCYRDETRFSAEGKFRYKKPKPENEKAALRRVILDVRPDILAVQEIGGNVWLDELAADLERAGLSFPYRILLEAGDSYNRNAVLSRVPFSKTIKIVGSHQQQRLIRGLLGIVVPVCDGKMLYVYNVHLKSKVSSDPDDPECNKRRLGEARIVRRLIEYRVENEKTAGKIPSSQRAAIPASMEKNPPSLFVLTGDFNDDPDSPPLDHLTPKNFAFALPATDADGRAITYFNPRQNYFHTFDYLLVSPEIYKKHYVPQSAKIANDPYSAVASDHRLVYADFDFSAGTPTETIRGNAEKEEK